MTSLDLILANTTAFVLDAAARSYSSIARRPALGVSIGLNIIGFLAYRYWNSPWRKLPPGPTGYPFLGSALKLLDIPWLAGECSKLGACDYTMLKTT